MDPATKEQKKNPTTGAPLFKWAGDVVDGGYPPLKTPDGKVNPDGRLPFIMKKNGVSNIFGNDTLADGPFPEHYEPLECPIQENPLSKAHRINPTAKLFYTEAGKSNAEDIFETCSARYPFVATTYRVTEHWQTGLMTRNTPWLLEAVPEIFVEMSRELAAEKGIENGDTVEVSSARGEIKCKAIVTARFKPFKVMGGHRAPGRHALVLRLAVPGGRQRRRQLEPADADHRRRQHHDSRDEGLHGQRRESVGGPRHAKERIGRSDALHRLPGLPGGVQVLERAGREEDG